MEKRKKRIVRCGYLSARKNVNNYFYEIICKIGKNCIFAEIGGISNCYPSKAWAKT